MATPDYLNPQIFEASVNRKSILQHRSAELRDALDAIREYSRHPGPGTVQTVSHRLHQWQTKNPKEFADRGSGIEVSLRAQLRAAYAAYGLSYDSANVAQPFMYKSDAKKQPIQPDQISPFYYYHVCSFRALRGIKRTGLDPAFGGRGGAGDALLQRGGPANAARNFNIRSQGVVHGTTATHTAVFYAVLKDLEEIGRGLADWAIVLRFPKGIVPAGYVTVDPDDSRHAFRISVRIPPNNIEGLFPYEGWIRITDLAELDSPALDACF